MKWFSFGMVGLLVLAFVVSVADAETLIAKGSSWRYLDNGSNQGVQWQMPSFNDSAWKVGVAQLGYGEGDEPTVLNSGTNPKNAYITSYFRRHFNVAGPADYVNVTLNLLCGDGVVIYLNGKEVHRANIPAGAITYKTMAAAMTSNNSFYATTIPASALVAGENVIAVEVHQAGITDTHLSFELELTANNTRVKTSAKVIRGPYLQMATPNSMTVRWRTDTATNSRVNFGTVLGHLDHSGSAAAVTTEHEVTLTGLLPETRYWYSVGTTSATLAGGGSSSFFKTSPASGVDRPTRIWVIGDAGALTAGQAAVYNAYRNYTGSIYTNAWLMLGDNVYETGTDAEYQNKFFAIYPDMLKQTPVWLTFGNHDAGSANSATQSGPYYDDFSLPKKAEAGGVASGTEAYYSFNYSNIHFVVLDSQGSSRSTTGAMANWLKADLQANKADWLIAYWHHPPYSKGNHDSDTAIQLIDMRQNFLPILEGYGVDLVLSGHSHAYERSKFIDRHYGGSASFSDKTHVLQGGGGRSNETGAYHKSAGGIAHDGTVYVVAGCSGKLGGGTLNHQAMFMSLSELGSLVLDINGLTLNAKFLNAAGIIRDNFTIVKDPIPSVSKALALQNGLDGYAANVDSTVMSSKPAANYGKATDIIAGGNAGKKARLMAVLKWDKIKLPTKAVVEAGTLTFTFAKGSLGAYNIYALKKNWSENTVNWNLLNPSHNLGALVGVIPPGGIGTRQVKLNPAGVALVRGWASGKLANNGLIVVDVATGDEIDIRSSEYVTVNQRPKLVVAYH
jgi:Calcineurin-like phosphoesterase/Purple acid Phosphatase, N-terminal domain